ncbi:nucleotidyltransferase family protein [Endozoicomonas numazuensis]|uniref:nucleotidyltransferase family protein n=1 Tax=Endozoicomonas numazuensis TaxID=1137799 RepID=UPI00191C5FDB|nr:nucleotidyltransferase domain-containing protein [Endozoicomonas numazuensis]
MEAAVRELDEKYQPHTIIVYGSRARNDATATSDIDIACFCDETEVAKDARDFQGIFLDAWIYQTEDMQADRDEFLKLGDGFCALDTRELGGRFLKQIRQRIHEGPEPMSCEDQLHTVEWIRKMLKRIEQDDLEGMYRRTWLQTDLLEIYFQLRRLWYFGPKKSLSWLSENDRTGFNLFKDCYQQPTNLAALTALSEHVTDSYERRKTQQETPDNHENKKSTTQ